MLETVKEFCDRHNVDYSALVEELARQRLAAAPHVEEVLTLARRRLKQRQQGHDESATAAGDASAA